MLEKFIYGLITLLCCFPSEKSGCDSRSR